MELITSSTPQSKYTQEQIAFIESDRKLNIILKATAGAGKTFCCTERVRFLLASGVPADKIIFFSFTKNAVEEFKSRLNNESVKVTTIHSFCASLLQKMQKGKKIVEFYEFIKWYSLKCKPKPGSSQAVKDHFFRMTGKMYDDAHYISSQIAAYKLQTADNIKCKLPKYMIEYWKFTKETKSRDFSDMLIEVRDLLKDNKWLRLFKNKYDYILVDEFQDTSTVQMEILLALNAKYYTIIGDRSQSIFSFSGANCDRVISMLKKRRDCVEMSLSTNFRSKKSIVENSNKYSDLHAVPFSQEDGNVHNEIILFENLITILNKYEEVAILVRANSDIKDIEYELLLKKQPLRYFNYITLEEIKLLKKSEEKASTTKKIKPLLNIYKTVDNLVMFIEQNQKCKSFVTSVHKSKGREFDVCVVVNCISPELIKINNLKLSEEQFKELSFDPDDPKDFEEKNIHYVAISRPKSELYFMLHNI